MSMTDREKQWANYRALYQKLEVSMDLRESVGLMTAKNAEYEDLMGRGTEGRFATFGAFLKDLVQRKPTWFTPDMIEWAHDRRSSERGGGE